MAVDFLPVNDVQEQPTMEIWAAGRGLPGRVLPFHVASAPVPADFDPFRCRGLTVLVGPDGAGASRHQVRLTVMLVNAAGRQYRVLYHQNVIDAIQAAASLRQAFNRAARPPG